MGKTLVELVIRRLKDQGYLNDARYAAAYSSFRRENEKFGRRRVITDLKTKGVHAEVIEKAVESVYGDVSEERLAREYLKAQTPGETERQEAERANFSSAHARRIRRQDDLRHPEEMGRG